nr:translation initiation factor IF-2-like [Aegilops tauschii subsp. strangulata]
MLTPRRLLHGDPVAGQPHRPRRRCSILGSSSPAPPTLTARFLDRGDHAPDPVDVAADATAPDRHRSEPPHRTPSPNCLPVVLSIAYSSPSSLASSPKTSSPPRCPVPTNPGEATASALLLPLSPRRPCLPRCATAHGRVLATHLRRSFAKLPCCCSAQPRHAAPACLLLRPVPAATGPLAPCPASTSGPAGHRRAGGQLRRPSWALSFPLPPRSATTSTAVAPLRPALPQRPFGLPTPAPANGQMGQLRLGPAPCIYDEWGPCPCTV